jgi:tRNA(Ile)-lysidine synthase
MGPDPAVAAVRLGVRRSLAGLGPGALALAACSGGPDSLALAAALAFEAPRLGLRAGAITVDHGLQPGSADQAERVAATLRRLGLEPVHSVRVDVATRGGLRRVAPAGQHRGQSAGYPGPEAAARQARYAAIEATAVECGAAAVLLGHTLDDQAETVLLGLARGSGARSLAGMSPSARLPARCSGGEPLALPMNGPSVAVSPMDGPTIDRPGGAAEPAACRYLRPLLRIRRGQTRAACAALGLEPWDDPQNADVAFARARVRHQILPLMEDVLGPGITEALARTADRLRADADALDAVADEAAERLMPARSGDAELTLGVTVLAALPVAIRTRVLKRAAIAAGAPAGSLSAVHVQSMDELVTAWHGQRWSDLPGGVRCHRRYGRLQFTTTRS